MNSIAMVTGAGSGIGKACALALLAEGWQVFLVGRREDALRATALAAKGFSGSAHIVPADVSNETEVAHVFAAIRERCGRLDLLFNNAGIFTPAKTPDEMAFEDWRRSVDVNLNGAFYCLSHAFGLMRGQAPRGGRMDMDAVVQTFMAMVRLPLSANVLFTTVMATKMPFVGRG